jgi:hypothetical protein
MEESNIVFIVPTKSDLHQMSAEERDTYVNNVSTTLSEFATTIRFMVDSIVSQPSRMQDLSPTSLLNELIKSKHHTVLLTDVNIISGGASKVFRPAVTPTAQTPTKPGEFMIAVKLAKAKIGKVTQIIFNGTISCKGLTVEGPFYKSPVLDIGNYNHIKLVGLNYIQRPPYHIQFNNDKECTEGIIKVLNQIYSCDDYVASSGTYYYTLASHITKKYIKDLTMPTAEEVVLADEYVPFMTLFNCRIGKNYDNAYVADLLGRGINMIRSNFDSLQHDNIMTKLRNKSIESLRQQRAKEIIFIQTGARLFGHPWIETFNASANSFEERKAKLGETKRKKIENEIANYDTYIKSILQSTCEHVRLYNALLRARATADLQKAYNALQFYIGKPTTKTKIHCNKCNIPFICPHKIKLTEMVIARATESEISTALYAYQESDNGVFSCKICGETLQFVDHSEIKNVLDKELSKFIFTEVSYIIRKVNFPPLTQIGHVVRNITDKIYPFIYEIDRKISKNKLASISEIAIKKRLYTAIYIYAVLAASVSSTVYFKNFKYNNTVEMFKRIIEDIMYSYNTIIKQIPQMNIDTVKNILVEAYKLMGEKVSPTPIVFDVVSYLLDDDIYNYCQVFSPRATMNTILGDSYTSKQTTNLFKNIRAVSPPPLPKIMAKWWKQLPYVVSEKPLILSSFKLFSSLVKSDLYTEHVYVNTGYDKRAGVNTFDFTDARKEYNKQLAELVLHEHSILDIIATQSSKNFSQIVTKPSELYPTQGMPMVLSRLYGVDGHNHKWLNGVCTVCKAMLAEQDDTANDKIYKKLKLMDDTSNFYLYYQMQCPEGGMHVFNADTCDKCGYQNKQDKAYFDKYFSTYEKRNEDIVIVPEPKSIQLHAEQAPVEYPFSDNMDAVIELADKLNINRKHLECLGSTEGIQFTLIKSGQYIPPQPEFTIDTQIYNVFSRVMYLQYEYNILRNFTQAPKGNPLASFITAEKIDKWKLQEISSILPDIYDNFNEKFEAFKLTRKPRELHTWLICEFSRKLMTIFNAKDAKIHAICKAFFFYICKKILRYDEMLTKRGWFNMSLLYGDGGEQLIKTTTDVIEDSTTTAQDDDNPFDVSDFGMEDGDLEDGEEVEIKFNDGD